MSDEIDPALPLSHEECLKLGLYLSETGILVKREYHWEWTSPALGVTGPTLESVIDSVVECLSDGGDPSETALMVPELTVFRARNGWILNLPEGQTEVVEEVRFDDAPGLGLLIAIQETLGLVGSRYDARRIVISWEPGDKHHDFHPRPCAECDCGCDPDRSTGEDDCR